MGCCVQPNQRDNEEVEGSVDHWTRGGTERDNEEVVEGSVDQGTRGGAERDNEEVVEGSTFWNSKSDFVKGSKATLSSGVVRLVSAQWLVKQSNYWKVLRSQDLSLIRGAFVTPERAVRLFEEAYGIVAVSYGWLSKNHPDPNGFHFNTLKKCLELLLEHTVSDLSWLNGDVGTFWDYASMPQPPRSVGEDAIFKKGLGAINSLYGSPESVVFILRKMPDVEDSNANLIEYDARGWCTFEEAIACLIKPTARCLDLGALTSEQLSKCTSWRNSTTGDNSACLVSMAVSARKPPIGAESMRNLLSRKTFTNKADCSMVADKYGEFLNDICPIARTIAFPHRGNVRWDSEQLQMFARFLPHFSGVELLDMRGHHLDDQSMHRLCEVLPKLHRLSEINLRDCSIEQTGLDNLCQQLPQMKTLGSLVLPSNLKDTASSKRLSECWSSLDKPQGGLLWK